MLLPSLGLYYSLPFLPYHGLAYFAPFVMQFDYGKKFSGGHVPFFASKIVPFVCRIKPPLIVRVLRIF